MGEERAGDPSTTECVHLRIPRGRAHCAQWVSEQAPEVVSQVLAASEIVYAALQRAGAGPALTNEVEQLSEQLAQERRRHGEFVVAQSEEVAEAKRKLTEAFSARSRAQDARHAELVEQLGALRAAMDEQACRSGAEREAAARHAVEQWRQKHAASRAALEQELHEAAQARAAAEREAERARLDGQAALLRREGELEEEARARVQRARSEASAQAGGELAALREDAEALRGRLAVERARVAEEYEALLHAEKRSRDAQHASYEESHRTLRGEKDARYAEMKQLMERQVVDAHAQRDDLRAALAAREAAQSAQGDEMAKTQRDMIKVVQRLTGNVSTVGAIGETFVADVHAKMQLGTLAPNTHAKAAGHGDATWRYDALGLSALVEDKYGCADTGRPLQEAEVKKFERDVRSAIEQGRVNAAIIISLEKRIPGKPHLAADVKLGVPTVWASRDAHDLIPARALVELAFQTMVEVFALVQSQGDSTEVVVRDVSNHVRDQLDVYEALQKQANGMVAQITGLSKKANDLLGLIDKVLQNARRLCRRHPALLGGASADAAPSVEAIAWWEGESGRELLARWRAYHEQKKRHPRDASELALAGAVAAELARDPTLWEKAGKRMRDEVRSHARAAADAKRLRGAAA